MNQTRKSQQVSDTTRVIFLRHGQSTYNELKLYQGCCDDSLLNAKGKVQAYQSGEFISSIPIDKVYTSPLQRTQESAKQILGAIASRTLYIPRIETNPYLKEVDIPGWQGLPFKYVREHLAQDYQVWEDRPHEFVMETIASSGATLIKTQTRPVLELYKQAEKFWKEVLPNNAGKNILVVSHGGTIRALIGTALGIEPKYFHALQQSNCGISMIKIRNGVGKSQINDFEKSNAKKLNTRKLNTKKLNTGKLVLKGELEGVNTTQHLGEILPKLKNGKYGLRLLLLPTDSETEQKNQGISGNIANILKYLQSVDLDFCLSADTPDSQRIVNSLLKSHSKPPLTLQVSHQGFLSQWHKFISNRNSHTDTLQTGIAIAHPKTIVSALNQIVGLDSNSEKIAIQPNTVSILFYPTSQNKAVIQAMNISHVK